MRLIVEILIAAALIGLAWEKSYQERVAEVIPSFARHSADPAAAARPARRSPSTPAEEQHQLAMPSAPSELAASPAPTHSGSWMWDPKRPASLDRPNQSPTPRTFTNHIYYVDDQGHKYWLDGQGNRHYE